ncbi:dehydration-responsive element-binding protein 1F-like isoform X1 [Canna indica]|uniref:Dehydration-responsive element-binding protein 1F-like isoform X1 n=1 Tax=Canna indica TaxID=4628 RepID=A0AAQ3JW77_9LILI|nr:dehydration-responsive element-binding protein 1F-like isoform X1 [Canna indica]
MDFEDHSPSSSCCSSSSSSGNPRPAPCPSPKRKGGRKKFRETRHPLYHGVRARNGGKWVSEVREPRKKSRIWLGTYRTPETAAVAHDVAAIALRGDAAHLNFPDLARALPRAKSTAPEDVRRAAAEAAVTFGRSHSSMSSSRPPPPPTCRAVDEMREVVTAAPPTPPPAVFVDEEALFNMPGLLEDMARGLLVTPPALQKGVDWDELDEGDIHVSPLWTD